MNIKPERMTDDVIIQLIKKYSNMLFRICIVILANEHDAEDALQETFLRYINKAPAFDNDEHEKAWLIRVATNICKDIRRFKMKHTYLDMNDFSEYYDTDEKSDILQRVMNLKLKYKEIILLYYVEDYNVGEISKILGISVSATKKRLQYGRDLLKLEYRKEL